MIKKFLIVLLGVFIIIQFFRPEKNILSSPSVNAIEQHYLVPQAVQFILKRSCYDCHSNNTVYPWYNNIQPVAWLLARNIKKGKKHLNFDEFNHYTIKKKKHKLNDITDAIKEGWMPLGIYTLAHREAIFSADEKQRVIAWADSLQKTLY